MIIIILYMVLKIKQIIRVLKVLIEITSFDKNFLHSEPEVAGCFAKRLLDHFCSFLPKLKYMRNHLSRA